MFINGSGGGKSSIDLNRCSNWLKNLTPFCVSVEFNGWACDELGEAVFAIIAGICECLLMTDLAIIILCNVFNLTNKFNISVLVNNWDKRFIMIVLGNYLQMLIDESLVGGTGGTDGKGGGGGGWLGLECVLGGGLGGWLPLEFELIDDVDAILWKV